MTRLSIIIPTLNAGGQLAACLSRIGSGVHEIVVSDGGSGDDSLARATEAGAKVVVGEAGRGGQLARGAQVATGHWLLFLHADSHLPEDWRDVVEQHIDTSAGAAAFRLRFRASGLAPLWLAGWANLRSRMGLPYGDQGLLVSAEAYEAAGGFPDIPLMEDVAMARRLGKVRLLPATLSTSAERYECDGWLRRSLRNGHTLARYLTGTPPAELVKRYESSSADLN